MAHDDSMYDNYSIQQDENSEKEKKTTKIPDTVGRYHICEAGDTKMVIGTLGWEVVVSLG